MTPQEQPDSQAGDELAYELELDKVIRAIANCKDPVAALTLSKSRLIRWRNGYAERLATERAIEELQIIATYAYQLHEDEQYPKKIERFIEARIIRFKASLPPNKEKENT